jgi:pimeloyl-ACP methyl ester carboxylesterase
MATFVLVHGAWHGGWCWQRVTRLLRARGHEAYAPTLTGLGERSHLIGRQVDLETHIADVLGVLRWEDLREVVLCGHSYGGMVVTGVADRAAERVAALVYLDAFVPADGQCVLDFMPPERIEQYRRGAAEHGEGYLIPPLSAAFFRVNEADQAWVDRQCVPQPLAAFEQRLRLGGAQATIARRHYIRAAGYASTAFNAVADRLRRDPSWRVDSLSCGHDAMLDMPHELVELLLRSVSG